MHVEPRWRALFEVRRAPVDALKIVKGVPVMKPFSALVLESRFGFLGR